MEGRALSFDLTAESVRSIAEFYKDRECSIAVGEKSFKISKELAILVSKSAFKHFAKSNKEFRIDLSGARPDFERTVANCLEKVVSLSEGTESVEFNESENSALRFLGKALKNAELTRIADNSLRSDGEILLKWTSKMLSGLWCQREAQNFCFKVCGEQFECPKVLARLISKKASESLLSDPPSDEIEVSLPEGFDQSKYLNAFSMFFMVLSGDTLVVRAGDAGLFDSIASGIGNEELLWGIRNFFIELVPIDNSNIYDRLKWIRIGSDRGQNSEAIEYAASKFRELNIELLQKIPIPIIEKVIKSPKLRLRSENQLFEFIQRLIGSHGADAAPLLSNVKFEYLESETVRKVNSEMICGCVWDSICESLHRAITNEHQNGDRWTDQPNSSYFEALESRKKQILELQANIAENGKVFNNILEFPMKGENGGVFAFFYRLRGKKNPHLEGIVTASASSNYADSSAPENALVWGDNGRWCANDNSNEWYQIDFGGNYFVLSEFTVLAYPYCLPRRFALLASDDGNSFKEIKEFTFLGTDRSEMKVFHFFVGCKEPHRFFEILQKELCANDLQNGNYYFQFNSIEFFGTLKMAKESECQAKLAELEKNFSNLFNSERFLEFPMKRVNNGFFAFIYRMLGNRNPHTAGIINATASSSLTSSEAPENALIWGDETKWSAKYYLNEWYQIDFKENLFYLSEFMISTIPSFLPRRFTILASNDGNSFVELKSVSLTDYSESSKKTFLYSVGCGNPYRFFKILQKDFCCRSTTNGDINCFQLYSIEFFGTLKITNKNQYRGILAESERVFEIFNNPKHILEFPMKREDDGVFAFFYRLRGSKNPHSEGIVAASASSMLDETDLPENPLVWNGGRWSAKSSSNDYYQIDFKGNFFALSDFTILTLPPCMPRRFSLLASDDGKSFIGVKEFAFTDIDGSKLKTLHFSVGSEEPHRIFRIHQIDNCAESSTKGQFYCFQFWSIEFFGSLQMTKN